MSVAVIRLSELEFTSIDDGVGRFGRWRREDNFSLKDRVTLVLRLVLDGLSLDMMMMMVRSKSNVQWLYEFPLPTMHFVREIIQVTSLSTTEFPSNHTLHFIFSTCRLPSKCLATF